MNVNQSAYERQLAALIPQLLPGVRAEERLELLDAMTVADMRSSLAFVASMYPQVFDFALVRDQQLAVKLRARVARGGRL